MIHALRTPFLRPSSHATPPVSPRGDGDLPPSRPSPRLSLGPFGIRKALSASEQPSTPPATLVQDGSYLEALSLKFGEAASKALVPPSGPAPNTELFNGKRPIPPGRGHTLGELITAELNATHGNLHLQRAILRVLQRPLSVILTNLSAQLLPLISSPAFLNPPALTPTQPAPNATQTHALALAQFAAELLECLEAVGVEPSIDSRSDVLKATREGLTSVINRVFSPLVSGIRSELLPVVQGVENTNPAWVSGVRPTSATKVSTQHPSIAQLQIIMPLYAKVLARYAFSCNNQTSLATFLISLIWNALVALSHRCAPPRRRTDSMSDSGRAVTSSSMIFKKRMGTSQITPPTTPPPNRFGLKLPPSRPASPPPPSVPSTVQDARTIYDLLSLLPRPSAKTEIAREAVDEAFESLAALTALLGAMEPGAEIREDLDLELLTSGLPTLIALPVLLRWCGHGEAHMIPTMLGIGEADYRKCCLSGFGRADECAGIVVDSVLESLAADNIDIKAKMVAKWLEARAH